MKSHIDYMDSKYVKNLEKKNLNMGQNGWGRSHKELQIGLGIDGWLGVVIIVIIGRRDLEGYLRQRAT